MVNVMLKVIQFLLCFYGQKMNKIDIKNYFHIFVKKFESNKKSTFRESNRKLLSVLDNFGKLD